MFVLLQHLHCPSLLPCWADTQSFKLRQKTGVTWQNSWLWYMVETGPPFLHLASRQHWLGQQQRAGWFFPGARRWADGLLLPASQWLYLPLCVCSPAGRFQPPFPSPVIHTPRPQVPALIYTMSLPSLPPPKPTLFLACGLPHSVYVCCGTSSWAGARAHGTW